jgi:BioD-like phosphotransacetylase family protein
MKSLYVTSIEPYSGKTAACLAVGKRLKSDGYSVKYVKPLSLQPWRVEGKLADEDTAFVKEALDLTGKPWELSPVVVTSDVLRKYLSGQGETNLLEKVKNVCEETIAGCDILLLEGGGSLREGYVMGLPTPLVATTLGSVVLLILKYSDEARLLDDVLASKARLGQALGGVIINRVPEEAMSFVTEMAVPYLEKQGIPVFGVLPEVRSLAALTVQELIDVLGAEVLTNTVNPEGVVENITVGAMTAEAALSHFRRQKNKAVITGGDRTEIQLAALETSTTCLILTGNLQPSSLIVRQADQSGVPVLLVRGTTMETIEKIDSIFGKTRLGQAAKLQQFEQLLAKHADIKRLYKALGL